ncbi:MAG: DMT family transporter [Alphaproteobacteria bacterium]|nr:DMT family transporter [Alphaproteobacteria bacterium]
MSDPRPRPTSTTLAFVLAPSGAIAIGGVPYLAVELSRSGVDSPSLMFWRYLFALGMLLPLALALRQPLASAWRNGGRPLLLTAFTLGTFQTFCYFQAVERMPTSVAILLFYVYPLFTLAVQRWWQGRRAPVITLAACLLIVAGAALMAVGTLRLEGVRALDWFFAGIVPVSYGVYVIVLARYTRVMPALTGATFIQLGLFGGYILVAATLGLKVPAGAADWGRAFAVASIGSALPMLALAYSLPRLGPAGFGIMSSLELVTVVVLGVWLLGESLSTSQWLGVACVLAGILIYRPPREAPAA